MICLIYFMLSVGQASTPTLDLNALANISEFADIIRSEDPSFNDYLDDLSYSDIRR